MTRINASTFHACSNLEFVDFHDDIVEIGDAAFMLCRKLQGDHVTRKMRLPANLEIMGKEAFEDCQSIVRLDIPNLKTIPEMAFIRCTGLQSMNLPQELETANV